MKILESVKTDVQTDVTWNRVGHLASKAAASLPSASAQYLIDKVPIVGWLPRYSPRWIVNDVIAGLTLGLMMIPQALSYATLATIPVQYGLMSSWIPGALYAIMGTTKGLSHLVTKGEKGLISKDESLTNKQRQTSRPDPRRSLAF